jgi:HK97 family phage portal protein
MSIVDKLFNIKKKNDIITLFEKFGRKDANLTKLIETSYESNVDAYSVVKKIVDVYANSKWIVEQNVKGEWEEVEDTTIHDLMANPNASKGYTWKDIDEQLSTYLLTSGNSYLFGLTLNGIIEEVDVLPSNHIEIESKNDFFIPNLKYKFEIGKTKRTYDVDELEHIRMFNPSYSSIEESYKGLSVFQVASNVVQVGNDRWEADASLLQNRGAFGLITDQSDRPMTVGEAGTVQRSFDSDTAGPKKFGKTKVTNKNLKYIPMGMSSTDLQLVEKGVVTLRSMCNVLGLDSSLFNDPANKTFNNRLEAEKALYTNVIIPLSDKIAAKHNRFIVANHYPDGEYRMRKDFSNVEALQSDKKQEAEKDKIIMEGINIVLTMPIDKESKISLLKNNYNLSEETIEALNKQKDESIPN